MHPSITDMEVDRQKVYEPWVMSSFIVEIKYHLGIIIAFPRDVMKVSEMLCTWW